MHVAVCVYKCIPIVCWILRCILVVVMMEIILEMKVERIWLKLEIYGMAVWYIEVGMEMD